LNNSETDYYQQYFILGFRLTLTDRHTMPTGRGAVPSTSIFFPVLPSAGALDDVNFLGEACRWTSMESRARGGEGTTIQE
jgi:hypothetical protein